MVSLTPRASEAEWERKPLWGFGPTGWLLLPVFLAIVAAAWLGVDLQHQALRLIDWAVGWRAVFFLVGEWMPFVWHGMYEPVFGPSGLCVILVLLHLSPRRVGRGKYVLLLVWLILSPRIAVWSFQYSAAFPGLDRVLGMAAGRSICELLFTGGLLAWIMRDCWPVVLVASGISAARLLDLAFDAGFIAGGWPAWLRWLDTAVYHLGIVAGMGWWVVRSRAAFERSRPGRCIRCGYNLAGVPGSVGEKVCPECGSGPA